MTDGSIKPGTWDNGKRINWLEGPEKKESKAKVVGGTGMYE